MMRIRFFLMVAATALLAVTLSMARPKKACRAGKLENGNFVDKTDNYSLTLPEGWTYKIGKDDEPFRLGLVKEKYEKPKLQHSNVINYDDYAAPLLGIWVFESNLQYYQFLDSMMSFEYNTDLKKDMILYVHPNWDDAFLSSFKVGDRKSAKFDDHQAVFWKGIFDFRAKQGMQDFETPVGGAIICIQADDSHLMVILFRAEPEYTEKNLEELRPVLESIKFADSDDSE